MTFATKIQQLHGPHTTSNSSEFCAVDWVRQLAWLGGGSSTYLSSINLFSGIEQNFAAFSSYITTGIIAIEPGPIGLDTVGNVYLWLLWVQGGGEVQINGSTMALINRTIWGSRVDPQTNGGGFANVPVGTSQYMLDVGEGGGVIGTLDVMNVALNSANLLNVPFPIALPKGLVAPGPLGANFGYLLMTPNGAGATQQLNLYPVEVFPSQVINTLIGVIHPTDVDAGWTTIICGGMCLDQTDNNLILAVHSTTANDGYIIKINSSTAAVIWKYQLPSIGAADINALTNWSFSSIQHQRLYFICPSVSGSPPQTIVTINTSNGAATTQTANLTGMIIYGPQVSNDTLGGIVLFCGYGGGAGAPILLNSSGPTWSEDWAVLYVAAAIGPPTPGAGRRWIDELGPVKITA